MIYSAPRKGHKDWITLKASLNTKTNGYHTVKLSIKRKSHTKYVHDLVGKAFNQCNADPKKEWRHFPDPDKSNSRADNLVWGTRRENIWDRIEANGRTEDWNIFPTKSRKSPWMVHMTIPGKGLKHCGMCSSKEQARIKRDMLSLEFYAQCLSY